MFNQEELSDLIRDLNLSKKPSELLASRLNPNSTNVYKSSLSEKYEIPTTLWILIMSEMVFWKVLKLS